MDTVDLGALEAARDVHLRAGRRADAAATHEQITAHQRVAALEEERRGYVVRDLPERIEAVDDALKAARADVARLEEDAERRAAAAADRAEDHQDADGAPRERSRPPRKRA